MKKTYMTPAISVMAMETVAILAGSLDSVKNKRPSWDMSVSDPTMADDNQFSKDYTFEDWED